MKIYALAFLVLSFNIMAQAQNEAIDNRQISFSEPDKDSVDVSVNEDLLPKKNLVPISKAKLPAQLLDALEKEDPYKGWRNMPIYYDSNTALYMIRVKKGNTIYTYGLNKNGKPVTVTAKDE